MSTPEKEPIPESFKEWADNYVNKIDLDGHPNIRSHVQAEVGVAIMDVYRHLSSQKATPSDGSETEDEKNYRKLSEWYLKQLRECQDELRTIKSSQPSTGLRWVKVGGPLPKMSDDNIPIFRNIKTKKVYPEWVGGNHEVKQLYFGYGKDRVDVNFSDIEYLKETPSVQPIEGEQKPEWVEATTPPEKEGCYNVVTFENILIVTCYRYGRWEYDLDSPDWVVRYRPSTHQSLSAPASKAQPIADKEVPQEINKWMDDNSEWYSNDDTALWRNGAIAMYHKMQEEIWKAEVDMHSSQAEENRLGEMLTVYLHELKDTREDLHAARTEISTQAIQIAELETKLQVIQKSHASILASNKEWGEKYLAREKEVLDYRSALQNISDGCKTGDIQITSVREIRSRIAQLLDKYPSPTHTDKQ